MKWFFAAVSVAVVTLIAGLAIEVGLPPWWLWPFLALWALTPAVLAWRVWVEER